jgi:uncharacterized protein YukE
VASHRAGEMRKLADQLVSTGRQIGTTGDQIHSKAGRIEFEGPASRRFKDWVVTERNDANAVVTKLNDLAAYLRREADALDARAASGSPR